MIFYLNSMEELANSTNSIKASVVDNGFALIRGLFKSSEVRMSLPLIYSHLDNAKILGTTQGTRDTPRCNSTKWSVGCMTGAQPGNARLMITIYNPIHQDDIFNIRSCFERMISIRDIIRDDKKTTNDKNLLGESFNACRLQIYPQGGGFMLGHKDYIADLNSEAQKIPLLQLLLFVTQRGLDFDEGGAYIVHNNNQIDIEDFAHSGDLVIYNGNSFHGVADIDPAKPLNTVTIRGRVVALVTIYN